MTKKQDDYYSMMDRIFKESGVNPPLIGLGKKKKALVAKAGAKKKGPVREKTEEEYYDIEYEYTGAKPEKEKKKAPAKGKKQPNIWIQFTNLPHIKKLSMDEKKKRYQALKAGGDDKVRAEILKGARKVARANYEDEEVYALPKPVKPAKKGKEDYKDYGVKPVSKALAKQVDKANEIRRKQKGVSEDALEDRSDKNKLQQKKDDKIAKLIDVLVNEEDDEEAEDGIDVHGVRDVEKETREIAKGRKQKQLEQKMIPADGVVKYPRTNANAKATDMLADRKRQGREKDLAYLKVQATLNPSQPIDYSRAPAFVPVNFNQLPPDYYKAQKDQEAIQAKIRKDAEELKKKQEQTQQQAPQSALPRDEGYLKYLEEAQAKLRQGQMPQPYVPVPRTEEEKVTKEAVKEYIKEELPKYAPLVEKLIPEHVEALVKEIEKIEEEKDMGIEILPFEEESDDEFNKMIEDMENYSEKKTEKKNEKVEIEESVEENVEESEEEEDKHLEEMEKKYEEKKKQKKKDTKKIVEDFMEAKKSKSKSKPKKPKKETPSQKTERINRADRAEKIQASINAEDLAELYDLVLRRLKARNINVGSLFENSIIPIEFENPSTETVYNTYSEIANSKEGKAYLGAYLLERYAMMLESNADAVLQDIIEGGRIGGDIFNDIWNKVQDGANTVKQAFQGPRNIAPPAVRNFLLDHGGRPIVSITVCKNPIDKFMNSVMNAITVGEFDRLKKGLNYDDMFHLFMMVTFDDGRTAIVEKNAVANMAFIDPKPAQASMNVPINGKFITLDEMIANALDEISSEELWIYDPQRQNCQFFLKNLLKYSDLLTGEIESFIMQDTQAILGQLPLLTQQVFKGVTDLAGVWDVLLYGRGINPKRIKRLNRKGKTGYGCSYVC